MKMGAEIVNFNQIFLLTFRGVKLIQNVFQKKYAGKLTKKDLRLIVKIEKAESIQCKKIERLFIK